MITSCAALDCRKEDVVQPPARQYTLASFSRAEECKGCHPQYYEEWSGSMHRYSTSDPIWMLANNSLQASTGGKLKTTCFQCHSPIGFLTDMVPPSFQFSDLNDFVREGITCDFCHVMRPPYLTTNQHVQYTIAPGATKYGTLQNPTPTAAHGAGYDVSYDRSDVCRPCHDFVSNNVPVEITNTEWQNSPWGGMSVECQQCHMTTYTGRAAVDGPVRSNLHRHDFIGVDVAMGSFPGKEHQRAVIDSLMKSAATMSLAAPSSAPAADSLQVQVTVTNDRTGHNVPTSVFFFRQMWIEVTVWSGTDTAYRSGYLDANGDLMDKNSALSPNSDKDLMLFGGTLYKNGAESNVFELDSLVNNSIPPFASRIATYKFLVPHAGQWNVRSRLLFRPFGPYLFRSLGAGEYIPEIPTYEMSTSGSSIEVH
jgi:hypothetical protein